MSAADHPAWTRPSTHFTLLSRPNGKLTGEIECDGCHHQAMCIDEIQHARWCNNH